MYIDTEQRPKVHRLTNYVVAILLHLGLFLVFLSMGVFHLTPKETIIPMDLTVIVKENLEGKDDEPPPVDDLPPLKKEDSKPQEDPPPPPPPERHPDAVKQIEVPKTNKVEVVKKEDPKPSEPPKKTAAELRAERLAKMRESAKDVKTPPKPVTDGRTQKQTLSPEEFQRRLMMGYKPGAVESAECDDETRCVSAMKMQIDERWARMALRIGRGGTVRLAILLGPGGRLASCRLVQSCGDATSDAAAMSVVRSVTSFKYLTTDFIRKYSKEAININYKVESR